MEKRKSRTNKINKSNIIQQFCSATIAAYLQNNSSAVNFITAFSGNCLFYIEGDHIVVLKGKKRNLTSVVVIIIIIIMVILSAILPESS